MVAGKLRWLFATAVAAVVLAVVATAGAAPTTTPLSGAIFTTDVTGVPVNLNIYAAKEDVYLNGGPGINAPDDAAGLPAGTYSFQVTSPSGKTLLSTDEVACRQFTVDASGRIQSVAPSGACAHNTGTDGEDQRDHRPTLPVRRHPEQRRRLQGVGDAHRTARLRRPRQQALLRAAVRARRTTSRSVRARSSRSTRRSPSPESTATSTALRSRGSTPTAPATASSRSTTRRCWPSTRPTSRRPSRATTRS